MDETSLIRLEQLIAERIGLQLRPHEHEELRGTLSGRMAALRLRHTEEYNQLLQADTPESKSEWEQLSALLTNNESYFFRDKGQMALLRKRILPELIANNQARRTLRLWSAGCSTGEEAYSLAIMVDELLPRRGASSKGQWNIVILGTDIDGQALQQARRGRYGAWSFRTVEPALQQSYFRRQEDGFQIVESSRSLVTFDKGNLVGDPFPSAARGIYDMDLILCRNVFIYFQREAVAAVMLKFAQTLHCGGYLMTGHAEISGKFTGLLQARMFPESMVYQRTTVASAEVGTPNRSDTPLASPSIGQVAFSHSPNLSRETPTLRPPPAQKQATLAAPPAQALGGAFKTSGSDSVSSGQPSLLLQAQTQANLGHYEEAAHICERLIREQPFAPEPHELLASIAQEQGRNEEAKLLLKKAVYLAPASPSAYLELGALYLNEGDRVRARKMHHTALELLQQSPPQAPVGVSPAPTAQEWIRHLQQLLGEE